MNNRTHKALVTAKALIILGLYFLLSPAVYAGDVEKVTIQLKLTPEERSWIKVHPVIRIAPDPDLTPLEFYDADGVYRGLIADVMAVLSGRTGLRFEAVKTENWQQSLELAKEKKVDVLPAIPKMGADEAIIKTMAFSQAYLSFPEVILVRDTHKGPITLDDLEGKRVAVVAGWPEESYLKKNYLEIKTVLTEDTNEAIEKLLFGDVDAMVSFLPIAMHVLQNKLVPNIRIAGKIDLDMSGSMAVRNDWPELLSILQKGLDSISPVEFYEIARRWIAPKVIESAEEQALELSEGERAWLDEHPVIRVALDPEWAPVEYRDEGGRYQGMSLDYLEQLEKLLDVNFEVAEGLSWQEGVAAVQAKQADMFASVARTPQREAYARFTQPYVSMPINIFARNDASYIGKLENLAGKRVAVAENYAIHDWLENNHPELQLITVSSPLEGLKQVAGGDVDAFVGNVVTATYYLGKAHLDNVWLAGETPYSYQQAMAVREDWPILASLLQKALNTISQQEHATIYNRWMSIRFEHESDFTLLWQLLGVSLLVVSIILYWNRRLAYEIRKRKQAEAAVIHSEGQLAAAADVAGLAYWELDLKTKEFLFNDTYFSLLKTTAENEGGYRIKWDYYLQEFVHEEDRDLLIERINQILEGKTKDSDRFVYRSRRRDGSTQHALVDYRVNNDEHGNPVMLYGSHIDVTERMEAEENLKKSEHRYRGLVESVKSEYGFFALDTDGRVTYINEGIESLLALSRDEVVGKTWPELVDWDEKTSQRRLEAFYAALKGESPPPFEVQFLVDGEMQVLEISEHPMFDSRGVIMGTEGIAKSITVQKQREQELQRAKDEADLARQTAEEVGNQLRLFRMLSEESGQGIGMAYLDNTISYMNPRLMQMCEVSDPKEAKQGSFVNYYTDWARQKFADEIMQALLEEGQWTGELELLSSTGKKIPTIENFFLVRDQGKQPLFIADIITDISERKESEELLRQSEERFQHGLDFAGMGAWDWNIVTGDLHWSTQIGPLFGYDEGKLETSYENFINAVHPDDRDEVQAAVNATVEQGVEYNIEHRVVWPDGTVRWLLERGDVARDKAGQPVHMLGVVQDITRKKEIMVELGKAREVAEEATRAKSDFLANMSHELRTPLNAVIGFSELLVDQLCGPLNEKQQGYIEDILTSGQHLLGLINDILDLSKVESGKMELELDRFPLQEILNLSLALLREKALKHNINLSLELEPEADVEIEADQRKCKQMLFNLLSNALKFTPDGGSVAVQARKVSATEAQDGGDWAEISVVDTGIGIKPEDMPKLFKEFSQLESPSTKQYEGTGLGLALTRKFVELHGGRIWAESEFGKGSRFTFALPLRHPVGKAG